MAAAVSATDLSNRFGEVRERVISGEHVPVTHYRKVVARVVPEDVYQRLMALAAQADGEVVPA